jgi:hypothetical protein
MKDFDRIDEKTLNERELLDRFEHPTLSSALADKIVGAMSAEHRRLRIQRLIFRISLPAVAAMVAIVGGLFISMNKPDTKVSNPTAVVVTDEITQWVEKEQASVYNLFADLDFESLTSAQTQAAAVQADEWDTLFIEVMESQTKNAL